jgi:hypothetical protein
MPPSSIIELAKVGIGSRHSGSQTGKQTVAPVDRYAISPEVIWRAASEVLPVRADVPTQAHWYPAFLHELLNILPASTMTKLMPSA